MRQENILLTVDGHLKVLDFGLARFDRPVTSRAETGTMPEVATAAGMVMGTPGYMAPEQVRGSRVDRRADVFAIGCVLYDILVTEQGSFCIGWEAQQPWLEAHLHLATLYGDRGETGKAMDVLGVLLELWSDADPDIPLLDAARTLHGELAAKDTR